MWWCHACNAGFTADYTEDVPACTRCGENFVEFMPNAVMNDFPLDDDEDDDVYEDEGDELYDADTLQNLFFNYSFFGDAALRDRVALTHAASASPPPATNNGASEEAIDALPTVKLTAEHVANEPEVRPPRVSTFAPRTPRHQHSTHMKPWVPQPVATPNRLPARSRLPTHSHANMTLGAAQCAICNEDFEVGEPCLELGCNHHYHRVVRPP